MLPLQQKRMEDQLAKWGYSRYRIDHMEPFLLMSCYYYEAKKQHDKVKKQHDTDKQSRLEKVKKRFTWGKNKITFN